MSPSSRDPKPVLGWREWVRLPELGIRAIKAKVDTGARSSALHAWDVEHVHVRGRPFVRFMLHPLQRNTTKTIHAMAELKDERWVKSSSGERELRPVIVTTVEWDGRAWPIEVTLTNRDVMGFRMLLGREAVRRRFLVDPGASYKGPQPEAGKKKRVKGKKKMRSRRVGARRDEGGVR